MLDRGGGRQGTGSYKALIFKPTLKPRFVLSPKPCPTLGGAHHSASSTAHTTVTRLSLQLLFLPGYERLEGRDHVLLNFVFLTQSRVPGPPQWSVNERTSEPPVKSARASFAKVSSLCKPLFFFLNSPSATSFFKACIFS